MSSLRFSRGALHKKRAVAVAHAQIVSKNGGQAPVKIIDPCCCCCCCLQPSASASSSSSEGTSVWRYWSINGFIWSACLDGFCVENTAKIDSDSPVEIQQHLSSTASNIQSTKYIHTGLNVTIASLLSQCFIVISSLKSCQWIRTKSNPLTHPV